MPPKGIRSAAVAVCAALQDAQLFVPPPLFRAQQARKDAQIHLTFKTLQKSRSLLQHAWRRQGRGSVGPTRHQGRVKGREMGIQALAKAAHSIAYRELAEC